MEHENSREEERGQGKVQCACVCVCVCVRARAHAHMHMWARVKRIKAVLFSWFSLAVLFAFSFLFFPRVYYFLGHSLKDVGWSIFPDTGLSVKGQAPQAHNAGRISGSGLGASSVCPLVERLRGFYKLSSHWSFFFVFGHGVSFFFFFWWFPSSSCQWLFNS